jgi:HD-like signal output (HDOD) protein
VEEIENEMLEMSHSELGAELAIHWNLPEAIVSVLRYHHLPDQVEGSQTLVRLVNLAEKLLPTLGIIENTQQVVNIEEWQALGVDPAKADEIIEIVHNHNLEVESMFC